MSAPDAAVSSLSPAGGQRHQTAAWPGPILALLLATAVPARAEAEPPRPAETAAAIEPEVATADVVIDATVLFPVRGIRAYPAKERARLIRDRILKVAADRSIDPSTMTVVEEADRSTIVAGDQRLVGVVDADAVLEGVPRQQLAEVYVARIKAVVHAYRSDRTWESLVRQASIALGATSVTALLVALLLALPRVVLGLAERRYKSPVAALSAKSLKLVSAERIWHGIAAGLRTVRLVLFLAVLAAWADFVLGLFPWTRTLAAHLLGYLVSPLRTMSNAVLASIPDLMFLVVLVIVIRYLLSLARLFFAGVANGRIHLTGLPPEWARPTHSLVRLVVLAFAAVVAYPYVPGSSTAAFKGISLLLGVLVSLGATGIVGQFIAGNLIAFRRLFRIGDRVRIGDAYGDIVEIQQAVTRLLTIKNEEVIIPNSTIVNSNVINYSSQARQQGLILHTSVTIGYDTPWRQVNALLLLAAERTPGVLEQPTPFVLQRRLDDFYVNHELNVYIDRPNAMVEIESQLHRNILDAFNEYGVQIMSPHYRGDPETPKVVPRDQWHPAPARPPTEREP